MQIQTVSHTSRQLLSSSWRWSSWSYTRHHFNNLCFNSRSSSEQKPCCQWLQFSVEKSHISHSFSGRVSSLHQLRNRLRRFWSPIEVKSLAESSEQPSDWEFKLLPFTVTPTSRHFTWSPLMKPFESVLLRLAWVISTAHQLSTLLFEQALWYRLSVEFWSSLY